MRPHSRLSLVLLGLLTACTGTVDEGTNGPGASSDGPGKRTAASTCSEGPARPGPATPFLRLTRDAYDNTVRDLLGTTKRPARAFPADEDGLGFAVGGAVSSVQLELYMNAAEDLAVEAAAERLDTLLPCSPERVGEDACARELIDHFARRAYRRPVPRAHADLLQDLYLDGKEQGGFAEGIRLVIQTVLQSPYFLYRVELGSPSPAEGTTTADGTEVVALSQWERAARLSYFLWNTMPDETLFAAAEAGELQTRSQIAAQARRMLDDPRARDAVRNFYEHWLGLATEVPTKDPDVFPEYDETLSQAMDEETRQFIDYVLWQDDGTLRTLLTAPYSFINAPLAELYGLDGVDGDELVRIELPSEERAGVLTQPGLLARLATPSQSSPVQRGAFVREHLFCQPLPPPPDDLMVSAPEPDPSASTREQFAQHREDPACAGCHRLMDPIGFGFSHYDAVGGFRTLDGDEPVDASGAIHATESSDTRFDGAVELAHHLADSAEVQRCVVDQWFRYTFGRTETEADQCSLQYLYDAFEESGGDLTELLVALTQTDAFLYRRAGEVAP